MEACSNRLLGPIPRAFDSIGLFKTKNSHFERVLRGVLFLHRSQKDLHRRILWKFLQCICAYELAKVSKTCTKRKYPKVRICFIPARGGGYILLLIWGTIHTEALQQHSLLRKHNLGFDCISAPSVSCSRSVMACGKGIEHTSSFVVLASIYIQFTGKKALPPILVLCLLTPGEF